MRINRFTIGAAIVGASFFGVVTYQEMFTDNAGTVKTQLSKEIAAMPVTEEKKPQEYYGYKRAEIALQEYGKNIVEVPRGCNCGPEIDKYTEGNPGQWCAMFATWIANEAGSPLWTERTKSWRITNSRMFVDHLKQFGTWYDREQVLKDGLKPRIGDFVVFYRGDLEDNLGHIDVVVDQKGASGTAGLVGGNVKDQVAYRENFPYLHHYGFLGFGRPEK